MRPLFDVDRDLCIGCGLCHERAPDNLELPLGEVVARVKKQPIDDAEEKACVEAAEYCPTGALHQMSVNDLLPCDTADASAYLVAAAGGGS